MKLTQIHQSILLAGILAAIAATLYFKSKETSPAITERTTAAGTSARKPAASSRSTKISARSTLPSQSDPEFQSFLQSLEKLAASHPELALTKLGDITDPTLLSLALGSVATGWASIDPKAVAMWVSGLATESQQIDAAIGLIPIWTKSAPEDCLQWITQCPLGNFREVSMVELADAWSVTNPQVALTQFLQMGSEDGTARGLQTIVSQWALDSPDAAVNCITQIRETPRRDELLEAAVASLSNQNPKLAWKYCDRFTDPETAEQTRSTTLQAMAETHPQDAVKLAGNSDSLLAGVARGWFSTDEKAASAWINSLPDPEQVAKLREAIAE